MLDPTPEQIEAAAKVLAGISTHTTWSDCEVWGELDEWAEGYRRKARAALVAAAGAAPQESEECRITLEGALRECVVNDGIDMRDAVAASRAYAARVQVDEAELNRIIIPVLFNSMNYPEPHRVMGRDIGKLREALVLALIEGLTKPEPRD